MADNESAIVRISSEVAVTTIGHDARVVGLWLDGRSRHTQRAYRRDADRFFAFCPKAIHAITLDDLQAFRAHLATLELVDGSRHRVLAAVKSLFAFATGLGYLQFNVAQVLRMPSGKETLSDRILEEHEVRAMITGETNPRNKLLMQLVYFSGIRVSELVSLTWADVHPHRGAGVITVLGKGSKTRSVRLEGAIWNALQSWRGSAPPEAPAFVSRRRGGHLDESQVFRIVRAAAKRAGINKKVSTHWLRHCHASHALSNGADISLVQATLGHANVATTSRYLHARPNQSSSKFLPEM